MPKFRIFGVSSTVLLATAVSLAQSVTIYDNSLQNGFENYSYGDDPAKVDFASTAVVAHSPTNSISFEGDNFNAVGLAHPAQTFNTAQYPQLKFWIHGGAAGGQQLRIYVQNDDVIVADGELDSYIPGGAPVAGDWREVAVNIGQAPLAYAGPYDRIDIQSDVAGGQPVLYLDDIALFPPDAPLPANAMQIERDVTVGMMMSDRFTWRDSTNRQRVAVLAHNDKGQGPTAAGGYPNHGGALREFRYQMPDNTIRTAGVTDYGNGGYGGFGYVVSHRLDGSGGGIGDDSPLGYAFEGEFTRVFEGRHHAIFRFTQLYPRHAATFIDPPEMRNRRYEVPVTIDWIFSTGRDNPTWAVTWDLNGVPENHLFDDSRAPYGELNIDGVGTENISGVAWGDRYKFFSIDEPLTLNSSWNWMQVNTVPYVKLWITPTNATMGIVQTRPLAQQDAGSGRESFCDLRGLWGTSSPPVNPQMPSTDCWPYQANSFSILGGANRNARLTWGTMYGFLGQRTYNTNNGLVDTGTGYPYVSYSTHIVLGPDSTGPVEAQVTQVERIQTVTLSATTGTVVTSGPAGINRIDTANYSPAGYNHVYGALAFSAAGNELTGNIAVGAGMLDNPLLIISNYSAGAPTVKLNNVTLTADADYYASLRPAASELWITLNRDLTGANNQIQVLQNGGPPVGLRGDADGNGVLNVADILSLASSLFGGGAAPTACQGDANSDNNINVADIFFLVNHLFAGGPAPGAC